MINYLLVVSRQGKTRLAKWYATIPPQKRTKIVKEVSQLVLSRKAKMCNVIEYKGQKVIYRRYASLFFVAEIGYTDNELITLEIIHRYVELLDRYFGNVCEMDIIFNFQQAYNLLDECIISGEMVDTSLKVALNLAKASDSLEQEEHLVKALKSADLF